MKRKRADENLKARVALEAIKGELTMAEIVSRHKVHANQITRWKKELIENAATIFSKRKDPQIDELKYEKQELYKKVGEQTVIIDWLKKKSTELGLI